MSDPSFPEAGAVEVNIPRQRSVIEADLTRVREQLNGLEGDFKSFFDPLPEGKKKEIETFVRKRDEIKAKGEDLSTVPVPEDDDFKRTLEIYEQSQKLADQRDQLDEEFRPYEIEDLQKSAQELGDRIDYQGLVETYFRNDPNTTLNLSLGYLIHELKRLRGLENLGQDGNKVDLSYGDVYSWQGFVKYLDNFFNTHKLLKPKEEDQQGIREVVIRPEGDAESEFSSSFDSITKNLQDNYSLLLAYHQFRYPIRPLFNFLTDAARGLQPKPEEDDNGSQVDMRLVQTIFHLTNRELLALGERGFWTQTYEQRQAWLSKAKGVDTEAVFQKVQIDGIEQKEGRELVISQEELVAELKKVLPPYFLEGIDSITFTNRPHATVEQDDKQEDDIETVGEYFADRDEQGNTTSARIEIYHDPTVEQDSDELTRFVQKRYIMKTAIHEVTHHFLRKATVDELQAWDKVIVQDEAPITDYVKRCEVENRDKRKREDFCDSLSMITTEPEVLAILSKERYQFMASLLKEYSNNEHWQAFYLFVIQRLIGAQALKEQKNWTDDDFRRMYTPF